MRLVEQEKLETKKMLSVEVRKEEKGTLCGRFVNMKIFSFPEEVKWSPC